MSIHVNIGIPVRYERWAMSVNLLWSTFSRKTCVNLNLVGTSVGFRVLETHTQKTHTFLFRLKKRILFLKDPYFFWNPYFFKNDRFLTENHDFYPLPSKKKDFSGAPRPFNLLCFFSKFRRVISYHIIQITQSEQLSCCHLVWVIFVRESPILSPTTKGLFYVKYDWY